MSSALLRFPDPHTTEEVVRTRRAAIRQLERAEIYLAAVACMELDDRELQRTVNRIRFEIDGLSALLAGVRDHARN